jgi:hypothetical protein
VGLTITGTLPTFLPTTAHHRAVSGREAIVAWWFSLAGVVAIGAGLWGRVALVGLGNLLIAASALLVLTGILARLWEKGSGRLAFVQVSLGVAWLSAWAIVDGVGILQSGVSPVFGGWAGAAVIAGVGQVLAGSLVYLVPVLLGPLTELAGTVLTRRSWAPLVLLNLGGLALTIGWEWVAVTAIGLWVLDVLTRTVTLVRASNRRVN